MKKGWGTGYGVLMMSLEEGEQSVWAPSSKERTKRENFRHADGVGMEMRVRLGDMIVQSSSAICEEMRKWENVHGEHSDILQKARQVIQPSSWLFSLPLPGTYSEPSLGASNREISETVFLPSWNPWPN